MDTHIYQMFTDDVCPAVTVSCTSKYLSDVTLLQTVSLDDTGHIQSACSNAGSLSSFNHNQLWTIVGEWTPVMTDCAKYLNGRGVGARYDGSISQGAPVYGSCNGMTGSGATFSQDYRNFLRMSWEAQVSDIARILLSDHGAHLWWEGLDLRASERMDTMDVEDGAGGRMVVFCRPPVRVDPAEPH